MAHVDRSMHLLKDFEMSRKEWAENGDVFKMSLRDGKHRSALDVLSMPDIELDNIIAIMREKGSERGEPQFANFSVSSIAYETGGHLSLCLFFNFLLLFLRRLLPPQNITISFC